MTATVDIQPFSLPLETEFRTAAGIITERNGFFIRIDSGAGTGIGEATPLPGWTEGRSVCHNALRRFQKQSEVTDPWEIQLDEGSPAARHGITLAMFDAAAQAEDESLGHYLQGSPVPERIPVHATIGDSPVVETVEQACQAIDEGFQAIKVKVGRQSPSNDCSRIQALRAELGEHIRIRLDANREWDLPTAREVCTVARQEGVEYIEEPLAQPTNESIDTLRAIGVPIAADETLIDSATNHDLDPLSFDVFILKPMALGGIDMTISMAADVQRRGIDVVISNTIDGRVARTAAAHIAGIVAPENPAGLATEGLFDSNSRDGSRDIQNGRFVLPAGPGIGVHGDWIDSP